MVYLMRQKLQPRPIEHEKSIQVRQTYHEPYDTDDNKRLPQDKCSMLKILSAGIYCRAGSSRAEMIASELLRDTSFGTVVIRLS